jgi:leucyl-tRNA synthetase
MVTHETYRGPDGQWVEPQSVEIIAEGNHRRAAMVEGGAPVVIGDIEKMSKSKKNVVAPEDIFDAYGVDAARLFVMSDSPPERDVQWTNGGVEGAWRFVNRVWTEFDSQPDGPVMAVPYLDNPEALDLIKAAHRLIKALTDSIEAFRFNSGIAKLYEFLNIIKALPAAGASAEVLAARAEALSVLARLIAPFTPHLAEACWVRIGGNGMVVNAPWPELDAALAADDQRILPVQINGKRRGEVSVPAGLGHAEVEKLALADEAVARHLEGLTVRKVIVVTDRIVNIVAS